MLRASGIDTFYGEYQVLHDVCVEVAEGELVVLFGPNGHGKSTLLKTLCGLVSPVRGSVVFDGSEIGRLSARDVVEAGLVYVPEERHLFLDMTVKDNLYMGAYTRRARKKMNESYDLVYHLFPRLKEREKQYARNLSGGEAQMLTMARGLMSDARFLAIDEPSLGLAPNLVDQIFASIKTVNDDGLSVLMVEQNVIQACALADRVYLMEEGHIVMDCAAGEALNDERVKTTLLGA